MEEIGIGEFSRRSRLSPKALRLYDELGVLVPSRVDPSSGYRYYDAGQLEEARLVGMLRQLQLPLSTIKELLACDPSEAAARIASSWRDAEAEHHARRELAGYLVTRLNGERSTVKEVATREMPERSLLCLKRDVYAHEAWGFGKEFIAILRERSLPVVEGREGAFFCIYWGQVSDDSDGPIEWCRPVPPAEAEALAARCPELALRVEPAHTEAYVGLPVGPSGSAPAEFQLALESMRDWALEQGIDDDRLTLTPGDLGLRITYLATPPVTATSVPDCDVAVPFAGPWGRTRAE